MRHTFWGGIHPPQRKQGLDDRHIERISLPSQIRLPLSQNIGSPSAPLKKKGDVIYSGELIAKGVGPLSSRIHAPVSGTVKRLNTKPLPGGGMSEIMEIEVDKAATESHSWTKDPNLFSDLSVAALLGIIENAGIVGMGGATFPTHVKYSVPLTKALTTIVVNGAECEPYLTADHRLMVEKPREIVEAVAILQHVFGFEQIVFGVEANKPDAIEALRAALMDQPALPACVMELKVKYPQGSEKMLIRVTTGLVVPSGRLPLDIGVIVSNVGTLYAMYEALFFKKALIDRVITVAGNGIKHNKNLSVPIGTPLSHVVDFCGGISPATQKVIIGGPMMGVAIPSLDYSVTKGVTGILFLTGKEIYEESPCIRCAACVRACPMSLMPLKLAAYAKTRNIDALTAYNVLDCFECGACSHVCPARIPLVGWIRHAKHTVRSHEKSS